MFCILRSHISLLWVAHHPSTIIILTETRVYQMVFKTVSQPRQSALWARSPRLGRADSGYNGRWELGIVCVVTLLTLYRIIWCWRIAGEYPSGQERLRCRSRRKTNYNWELWVHGLVFSFATHHSLDNITYYKCDVSKWEEVEAVAKKVFDEVSRNGYGIQLVLLPARSVNRQFS